MWPDSSTCVGCLLMILERRDRLDTKHLMPPALKHYGGNVRINAQDAVCDAVCDKCVRYMRYMDACVRKYARSLTYTRNDRSAGTMAAVATYAPSSLIRCKFQLKIAVIVTKSKT